MKMSIFIIQKQYFSYNKKNSNNYLLKLNRNEQYSDKKLKQYFFLNKKLKQYWNKFNTQAPVGNRWVLTVYMYNYSEKCWYW